jgi:hypothetical protein
MLRFSVNSPEIAVYEDVKNLPRTPEILLIDVREPQELQDTGEYQILRSRKVSGEVSLEIILSGAFEMMKFCQTFNNFQGLCQLPSTFHVSLF